MKLDKNQHDFIMIQFYVNDFGQGDEVKPSTVVQLKEAAFSFKAGPHLMADFD